jgi:BolA family transcriptional regulator, general stress-responsive regulator
MDRVDWIESTLRAAFAPQHLRVEDESAKHAGHAGAASGGGHFRVVVVSETFRGQTLVERHGAVYAALGAAMKSDIHALALKTLTPEEWEQMRAAPAGR